MKYIVFFYFIEKRRHPLKKEFDTQKEAEDYIEQGKRLDDFGGWCLEECEIERG